jgi:hypothetical protein
VSYYFIGVSRNVLLSNVVPSFDVSTTGVVRVGDFLQQLCISG